MFYLFVEILWRKKVLSPCSFFSPILFCLCIVYYKIWKIWKWKPCFLLRFIWPGSMHSVLRFLLYRVNRFCTCVLLEVFHREAMWNFVLCTSFCISKMKKKYIEISTWNFVVVSTLSIKHLITAAVLHSKFGS